MATPVNVTNIQGDILAGGFAKKTQTFVFFRITDSKRFILNLEKFVPMIKTVKQVLEDRDAISKHKKEHRGGLIKLVGVNISFSYTGLRALGITDEVMAGTSLTKDQGIFKNGALLDAVNLKDPMSGDKPDWEPEFLEQIDGVLLFGGDSHNSVNEKINQVLNVFGIDDHGDDDTKQRGKGNAPEHAGNGHGEGHGNGNQGHGHESKSSIEIVTKVAGDVRPDDEDGHEHFGFQDGVSNPLIAGFDKVPPGPNPIDAKFILTGHDSEPVPTQAPTPKDWTEDGSFLVFRYLLQRVPEFNNFLRQNALKTNPVTGKPLSVEEGSDLLGARLVGRWKSGAPIDVTPFRDDPTLAKDSQRNNNFSFVGELQTNSKCPWAAHIRRTNPREDTIRGVNVNALDNRRIMRRGIAFGPELTREEKTKGITQHDRGLLFACYQANIQTAFRFIQTSWSNNPTFPFIGNDPKPSHVPGIDPLIGQVTKGTPKQFTGHDPLTANDPAQKPLDVPDFVIPRGGGYFFTPSLKTLKEIKSLIHV